MNGPHDLGGTMGFGPVLPQPETIRFHAEWEKRALALTLAAGALGLWSLDAMRSSRESLHPVDYMTSSYYQIWLKGLVRRLQAAGLVSAEELATGRALEPGRADVKVLRAARVAAALAAGTPAIRPAEAPARFAVGDRVRARTINPSHHTRLPRYARGRVGLVDAVRGVFVFPDTNAHGLGESPQWLYTICFTAIEIWGEDADPTSSVSIDAWESYLESA